MINNEKKKKFNKDINIEMLKISNIRSSKDLLEAFLNTMIIAITSTITSTIIGTMGAVGLYKYNFPFKSLINKLIYMKEITEIKMGSEITISLGYKTSMQLPLPEKVFIG